MICVWSGRHGPFHVICVCLEVVMSQAGWWFQTFLCSITYGVIRYPSHWLSYFSEGWLNHQPDSTTGQLWRLQVKLANYPNDSPIAYKLNTLWLFNSLPWYRWPIYRWCSQLETSIYKRFSMASHSLLVYSIQLLPCPLFLLKIPSKYLVEKKRPTNLRAEHIESSCNIFTRFGCQTWTQLQAHKNTSGGTRLLPVPPASAKHLGKTGKTHDISCRMLITHVQQESHFWSQGKFGDKTIVASK